MPFTSPQVRPRRASGAAASRSVSGRTCSIRIQIKTGCAARALPTQPRVPMHRACEPGASQSTIPATMTADAGELQRAPGPRRAGRSPAGTEPTGWIVSSRDARDRGGQARQRRGRSSSHPSTCEVSASVISHRVLGPARHEVSARPSGEGRRRPTRAAATHVASNSGPAGRRRSLLPWRRTSRNAGVGHAGEDAEDRAAQRVLRRRRPGSSAARDEVRSRRARAERRELRRGGSGGSLSSEPRGERQRGRPAGWRVTVAKAGADVGDRVVPEDQVGREEHAGDRGSAGGRGAARAARTGRPSRGASLTTGRGTA